MNLDMVQANGKAIRRYLETMPVTINRDFTGAGVEFTATIRTLLADGMMLVPLADVVAVLEQYPGEAARAANVFKDMMGGDEV